MIRVKDGVKSRIVSIISRYYLDNLSMKDERGKRKEERGKRTEEEERGKGKEEQGKMKVRDGIFNYSFKLFAHVKKKQYLCSQFGAKELNR